MFLFWFVLFFEEVEKKKSVSALSPTCIGPVTQQDTRDCCVNHNSEQNVCLCLGVEEGAEEKPTNE